MASTKTTATFTSEFRHEFETEREDWLRRRFVRYASVVAALGILLVLSNVFFIVARGQNLDAVGYTKVGIWGVMSGAYISCLLYVRRSTRTYRREILNLVFWLILTNGLLQLVPTAILVFQSGEVAQPGLVWLGSIFMTHLLACLFLPWTPWESFKPILPLLFIHLVIALVSGDSWIVKVVAILLSPFVAVPGVLICWLRDSRFRSKFQLKAFRGRYAEMKRELVDARRLHESLFPEPIGVGPIRFSYVYEPMRQIGGDYLYAHTTPDGESMSVVLIDVTGHGIPAALTVNRLHGELERLFAEDPGINPGEALRLLNKYVHLTLATHSVYVTAVCMRIDTERAEVEFASGGHPPAYIRAVDGTIEELQATSFVLGACADCDYDPEPITRRFGPGDALIAFTDGAMEARDDKGAMFGLNRLRSLLAASRPHPEHGWAGALLTAVEQFRFGPPGDDTLVIEISRPLDWSATSRSKEAQRIPAGPAKV